MMQGRGRSIAIAALGIFAAGLSAFAIHGWIDEHDARIKTETATKQQQTQVDALKQQQADTQRALDAELSSLQKAKSLPATATEVVKEETELLPSLPEPLLVQEDPKETTVSNEAPKQQIVIPEADFKSFRDAELTCAEDHAKLTACNSTEKDEEQELKLVQTERDEWKSTAKGGTLWHRALGAAKWFAAGAATGVTVYAVAHHK